MGWGTFTNTDYDTFKATHTKDASGRTKSADQIFTSSSIKPEFDPRKIKMRESCDSVDNPESTPIMIALDVTGSMGRIPHELVANSLGKLVTDIQTKKPVSDPHIMFCAVGDVESDSAPFQATQYEADIRIAGQLKDLFLEGGGGGNAVESYTLPYYFAANKTKIDSFDKRGRKGVLFTIGDEGVPPVLTKEQIAQVFGDKVPKDLTAKELLAEAEKSYDVFHLIVEEGYYHSNPGFVGGGWKDLLGERAILVKDYRKIPDIIVATLASLNAVAKAEATAKVDTVNTAIAGLKGKAAGGAAGGPKPVLAAA